MARPYATDPRNQVTPPSQRLGGVVIFALRERLGDVDTVSTSGVRARPPCRGALRIRGQPKRHRDIAGSCRLRAGCRTAGHSSRARSYGRGPSRAIVGCGRRRPRHYWRSIVTGASPDMPIARAAAGVTSMIRPLTNGPRSLIVTTTERPLL